MALPAGRSLTGLTAVEDIVEAKWEEVVALAEEDLGEEDFGYLENFDTSQRLLTEIDCMCQYQSRKNSAHLRQVRDKLPPLEKALEIALGHAKVRSSRQFWGAIHLMLELAVRCEAILIQVTKQWTFFANSLHVFEAYQNQISQETYLQEALRGLLLEFFQVTVFTSVAAKAIPLRIGHNELEQHHSWVELCSKFKDLGTTLGITLRLIRGSTAAKAAIRVAIPMEKPFEQAVSSKQLAKVDGNITVEAGFGNQELLDAQGCYYVPFPPNTNFYGRENILKEIEDKVAPVPGTIKTLVIWGIAGVGKTQIALEFANRQRQKEVKYIFWISSEHHSESAKAFTQIANLLNLKGATTSKGHEQNKLLVLQWLQNTNDSWLLIFDNIENQKLLKASLPACGSGTILITCRSEILAESIASQLTEIPMLTEEEGSYLMLKELRILEPTLKDRELAAEFSKELGGLSLAIDLISRHMRARKKPLEKFLLYYRENRSRVHRKTKHGIESQFHDGDLESLWSISFGQLDDQAVRVFRILCMLAPDRIPANLLTHPAVVERNILEQSEEDTLDQEDVEEIIVDLVDLALVRTNDSGTLLSVHRLVQLAFREHEKNQTQAENFIRACKILHDSFPQQKKGFTLFNHWVICESLVEHVQMLCQRFHDLCRSNQAVYLEDFTYLLSDCGRYLCEIGRYNAARHVVENGFSHCGDRITLPLSNLYTDMGAILNEQGHDKDSLFNFKRSLDLREQLLPPDDSEIANALSNCAIAKLGTGKDAETALNWLLRSLEIDESKAWEIKKKVLHLRHFNLCFAYKALEDWENFKLHLEKADEYVLKEFGAYSRYAVISDLLRKDGKLDEAYELCKKGKEIAEKETATSPWVSASIYKMGWLRLLQKQPDYALPLLEKALTITRQNEHEKSDEGDSARVLDKLARVHALLGNTDASDKARTEANQIYADLTNSEVYDAVGNEETKWEFLVCIKFR